MNVSKENQETHFLETYGIPSLALIGIALSLVGLGDIPLLVVIVIGGLPLLWETAKSVRAGKFNVDLVAIASIVGGLLIGQYLAAAIIVLMMSGGEALEAFALKRATGSLQTLLKERPRLANLVSGAGTKEVGVEDLKIGDHVLVRPGESVPTDGEIIEGESEFNEALLTGESAPVLHQVGGRILAGSINTSSPVTFVVTVAAEESTYSRIVELVKSAQNRKGGIQRLADRFGAWFTPITFVMVVATWLLTHNPITAYAVLVIATPCPLILATPVAIIAGIGRAARLGIIVKSGDALEGLARVGAVLFDKTGTLTAGSFSVVETERFAGIAEDEALRLAASLARYSNHAVSLSLVETAHHQKLNVGAATSVTELPGKGIAGEVEGHQVLLGNFAYLKAENVTTPREIEPPVDASQVCLSVDGKLAAVFTLKDTLRPESKTVLKALTQTYAIPNVAMLTGDREAVAQAIATQLGGIDVHAGLTPEDKLQFVEKTSIAQRKLDRTAVMVGDGINDAPALERADIGVAIGKQGGEVAVESADIVLLGNRLQKLPDAIGIGRSVLRIASAGIWFGMGCSLVGMFAAAFGYLPPVVGALMQEVIDALVILNALRVLKA